MKLAEEFGSLLLPPFTVMIRNFKVGSFVSRYATLFYIKKRVVVSEQSLVTKIEDFVGPLNGFAFAPFEEITSPSPRFRANDTIDVIGFLTRREKLNTYGSNGVGKQRVSIELISCCLVKRIERT